MGFFGPDYDTIGKDYEKSVNSATNAFVTKMEPYADSGKGANIQNQQTTSAEMPEFAWDVLGKVNDYLDPSLNKQIEASGNQIQNAYGNKGSLFSGAAARALSEDARSRAEQGWASAFDRAMNDNNRMNALNQQQFSNQMGIDSFNNNANQTNFQNQFGVNNANFSNRNDIYGTELGSKMSIADMKAQLSASEKSPWDYLMDAGKLGVGITSAVYGGK